MRSLTREARDGDQDALNELIRILEPSVVQAVRLVVGSGSKVAEDAAQDTLVEIWRSIGTLREPAAVHVWASRIAMRQARKAARWERLRAFVPTRRPEPFAIEPPESSLAVLKDAFDSLPQRMRAIAVLRLFLGLTEAETAEALECSEGSVKSGLHAARRKLMEELRSSEVQPVTRDD